MDRNTAVYLLVATNTAGAFSMFLPSPFSGEQYDDEKKRVAQGFSLAWSFGIAVAAASSVRSPVPLVWWGIVATFMYGMYEVAPNRLWRY